jgi:hypothetical protein
MEGKCPELPSLFFRGGTNLLVEEAEKTIDLLQVTAGITWSEYCCLTATQRFLSYI